MIEHGFVLNDRTRYILLNILKLIDKTMNKVKFVSIVDQEPLLGIKSKNISVKIVLVRKISVLRI